MKAPAILQLAPYATHSDPELFRTVLNRRLDVSNAAAIAFLFEGGWGNLPKMPDVTRSAVPFHQPDAAWIAQGWIAQGYRAATRSDQAG